MKYRIWDKKEKYYDDTSTLVVFPSGVIWSSCYGYVDQDKFIVEQSTGLKDKNGVEIYEGHRVKYSNMINPIIIFQQGAFGICEVERMIYTTFIEIDTNNIEVIGNIHE